jgi:hypothetical protein
MSRKQTRKSISIKGTTYRRIKSHCDAEGITMSSFFEDLTIQRLGPPSAEELQEVDPVEEDGQSEESDATPNLESSPAPQPDDRVEPEHSPIEVRLELEPDPDPAPRPRHRGSPIPDTLKPSSVQDQPEALTGYVPPILEF